MILLEITFEKATSFLGIVLSFCALLFTAYTVSRNTKVSRANFWLELRKRFSEFDDIHLKLRPGGVWAKKGSGPTSTEDWIKVEAYMGLFEHCNIMLNEGILDEKTFKKIYSYRLVNIVHNDIIADAKLRNSNLAKYWKDFIELLDKFEINYK